MIKKNHLNPVLRLSIVVGLLVLGACATRPISQDGPASTEPSVETAPRGEASPTVDLALNQMLNDARRNLAADNWQAATVSAERGLRIDRREPELYLLLAQAYVGLAEPQRALEFVRQGLRYASNELSPVTIDLKRLQTFLVPN